jgi:hypothetical protein
MEQWGIYVAYAWLATITWAFMDAVQAGRNWPQWQLQPLRGTPDGTTRLSN